MNKQQKRYFFQYILTKTVVMKGFSLPSLLLFDPFNFFLERVKFIKIEEKINLVTYNIHIAIKKWLYLPSSGLQLSAGLENGKCQLSDVVLETFGILKTKVLLPYVIFFRGLFLISGQKCRKWNKYSVHPSKGIFPLATLGVYAPLCFSAPFCLKFFADCFSRNFII